MMHHDDEGPLATTADWHRQWHVENPGRWDCPWDACVPPDDPGSDGSEDWVTMRCGHCHLVHGGPDREAVLIDIRECARLEREQRQRDREALAALRQRL